MDEKITLTKDDLVGIVEKAVNERLQETASKHPGVIFENVSLTRYDFSHINQKYDATKNLSTIGPIPGGVPVTLSKYPVGIYEEYNSKIHVEGVHDFIRKLTLSLYGVTLNKELKEKEWTQAAIFYKEIKDFYLNQYEKRISNLKKEDFE